MLFITSPVTPEDKAIEPLLSILLRALAYYLQGELPLTGPDSQNIRGDILDVVTALLQPLQCVAAELHIQVRTHFSQSIHPSLALYF